MNNFKSSSYLVRMFDFIRYFQLPHTLKEAEERFEISRRTVYRNVEVLQLAGVTFKTLSHANGFKGETNLIQIIDVQL